jgi:hypothetical protein
MPRPRERHAFRWRDVYCSVEHIPDWKIDGWSRLIIRVVKPRGAPLPVSERGYRVLELDEAELRAAGGSVAFLLAWFEREAIHPRYAEALYRWKQGDLFL